MSSEKTHAEVFACVFAATKIVA